MNFSIQISFYCVLILFSFIFFPSLALPTRACPLHSNPPRSPIHCSRLCRTLTMLCNYRDKCLFKNCWYSTFSAQLLPLILFSHTLPSFHAFPSFLSVFLNTFFFFLYSFQSTKWMCLISNKRGGNSSPVCFLKVPLPAPHMCFASLLGAGKPLLAPQLPPGLSTLEES